MSIYSFLVAVRSDGQQLMSDKGETTSHIMGMFYRTLRISEAQDAHEEAKETGTAEDVEKFSRRTVRVTREHNAECQRLLKLMGVPYIVAPTEAEAQCAVLARAGKVFAAASEDMDTLTFNSPVLLRHLTFSEQRKEPIQEIHLDKVLEGLEMDMDQVGPSTALKLIRDHGSIGKVIEGMRKGDLKYNVPDDYPYENARELFLHPDVRPADHPDCNFKWDAPDIEGLVKFWLRRKASTKIVSEMEQRSSRKA
ncbi:hypothetical protein MRB53_042129 [Persea americana]|nr:hypothetical protein MRB53_042129 [Persea americana]